MSVSFTAPCTYHERSSSRPSETSSKAPPRLGKTLKKGFAGPLPAAKVNFYKVHLACLRAISILSHKYHGDEVKSRQNCLCCAEVLVAAADRSREGGLSSCKELVNICREGMLGAFGEERVEDFLWKNT